jgi:hypothetical protein
MEPTGIVPVISCVQSGTAEQAYGLFFPGFTGIVAVALPCGSGWIRRD